jgi:hypothetical protein
MGLPSLKGVCFHDEEAADIVLAKINQNYNCIQPNKEKAAMGR